MNNKVHNTAKTYKNATIECSFLGACSIVGDNSKVIKSKLGAHVKLNRNNFIDNVSLDRFSYTGMNTVIMHTNVGAFTSISWNVSIGGADHDYSRMTQHSFLYNAVDEIRPNNIKAAYDRFDKPVKVGNDVWIAAGAVITRGVTIGDGAVIGANAVVTKDIPPYAIAVGSPAKIIKYRFCTEVISLLLQLKWWEWSEEKLKQYYNVVSQAPDTKTLKLLLSEDKDDTF